MSWSGDSSKDTKSTRSPRRPAAWAKLAETIVFAGAWGAREQNAAAPKETAAAEHGVEPGDAGGNPSLRYLVVQGERRDGQHADALLSDQKRKLVGAMQGAPVLHHPQVPCRDLVVDPVIQQDDAVGDIFLHPVAGQLFAPPFGGDDGGHALVLEPPEQPPQFSAQDRLVRQSGEECLQGVEHHAFRADGIDGQIQPDEETLEVVIAGLVDFAALNVDVIDQDFFLSLQGGEVESEGGDIGPQFQRGLLKRHEDSGLVELDHPADEKLRREQSLAAARATADQRGSAAGQTTPGDFIQTLDPSRTLGQAGRRAGSTGSGGLHETWRQPTPTRHTAR